MRGAILGGEKKWILLVSGCTFACRKRMKKQIYLLIIQSLFDMLLPQKVRQVGLSETHTCMKLYG